MENPVGFEVIIAAHVDQVARINAEDWKHQTVTGPLGRLRATRVASAARWSGKSTPQPRPAGEATAATAL
jgi:hypothetical protein